MMLVLPRHVEAGHDDQEDEQVVHGQAVLGEPAGEELQPELAAVEEPHPHPEGDGQGDVDRQVGAGLAPRRFVRAPPDDDDVEQQHEDRHAERDRPFQGGYVHRFPPVVKTPEVSSTERRVGPQHRSSDDGRRDDDAAAKEYSPPPSDSARYLRMTETGRLKPAARRRCGGPATVAPAE
jgi:hypothetical protein